MNAKTKRPLPSSDELAREFSRVLRGWIKPAQMKKVVKANLVEAVNGNKGVCHSHDYCDSNQAMIDAFEKLCGVEPDCQNDEHNALIDRAWSLAKANDFFISAPKEVAP